MKLKIKLISEPTMFDVNITDGRTLQDLYEELADLQGSSFILLGNRIIQKAVVERIEAE
ncbi:hypothetical protein ACJQ40_002852 [Enterococcus faecium]